MKNKLLPLVLLLFGSAAYSQVGIGTLDPNDSAQLEVVSADKGVLIPRVALLSREDATTITPGNVNSLLVFNTTDNDLIKPGFYYWFESKWEKLTNSTDIEELEAQGVGSISMLVIGSDLILTDVHGNSTSVPLSELNLLTTLIDNNNGSYTYTSENGTVTNINVTEDVANYFETILNEGPITIGGETYNTFEEYLTHVVKANETITTLVNNNNGTYTYVSENGTVTLIDVKGDVANYFTDILNEGPIIVDGNTYNTFEEYLETIIKSKETVTTLVNNNNGSYTYTSENGTVTNINVTEDVANYFETILNEGPITIGGETYNTFEEYLTHVVKSNETITTLTYNSQNNSFTYTNEIGAVQTIPLSSGIATISNELQSIGNLMTSNVNGETSSANIITSNVLSLNPTTKILTSSVNGVVNTGDVIDLSEVGIEPWNVQGGTVKASSNTENIYQMGKVAVGSSVWPTAPSSPNVRLYIEGDLELNGKFWSTTSVYADYVFEKYFTGNSNLKSDYTFNKLSDVKEFIKQNHHLPGVTPIGDLKKNENGYVIDFSKLSNEQLEKIEELYIHTIEQQELIEQQASEINSLKERLDRLEKLIK